MQRSALPDFDERAPWASAKLLTLWSWTESDFQRASAGSPLHRIGYARWRRNLAVAMGNAWREGGDERIARALQAALSDADELLADHLRWALEERC